MKLFPIKSDFQLGKKLPEFDQKTVKDEPMFFSADPHFAWTEGGPITRAFLDAVFADCVFTDESYCFDSRVHMLMPGWFPCIPGWHHDDVPRSRKDGQPNYENPEFHSQHILALINGDICPTEFAVGSAAYPDVPEGGIVYKVWHDLVEQDIKEGVLKRVSVPTNQLIHFDCQSFHQGVRAVDRGFRWFGRLSWNAGYEQGRPKYNEIRRQVNVYLEFPMEGW